MTLEEVLKKVQIRLEELIINEDNLDEDECNEFQDLAVVEAYLLKEYNSSQNL